MCAAGVHIGLSGLEKTRIIASAGCLSVFWGKTINLALFV
ncbi:hypothetical protein HMPREF0476_2055 [Kingella kingae ATCC 23330]|uniref:Uncharacterized protein n=1 Tax=Kingella kingae ATCC 23330 TaxID=887327 RepID=F5SA22_KINKI|nr:hypothetical protein HMPREF0476_2055 [Kingella kingae ATCC 23330]